MPDNAVRPMSNPLTRDEALVRLKNIRTNGMAQMSNPDPLNIIDLMADALDVLLRYINDAELQEACSVRM